MTIRLKRWIGISLAGNLAILTVTPAAAQIRFGVPGQPLPADSTNVCRGSNGVIFSGYPGDCDGYLALSTTNDQLIVGPDATAIVLDGANGSATFFGAADFFGTTNLNGQTNINGPLSLAGSITASGITSTGGLSNTGNFFNSGNANVGGVLSAGSVNAGTGLITGGSANLSGTATVGSLISNGQVRGTSFFSSGPATVQGFFNAQNGASLQGTVQVGTLQVFQGANFNGLRLQGVAAPTAGSDAANKTYVDGAVAGVQIGLTQATVDSLRQDQELADVRTVNTEQTAQIAAVQTVNTRQDGELNAVRAVNTRQDGELTDVRTVNAAQSAQLTTQGGQISAIQALDTQQSQQILSLQQGQATLFDLTRANERQVSKANEGVAMALAMESPSLPPGTTFALSGGVGYFNHRSAATTAFTARIADNASFSAGVGVGFKSGEVGARSGFQIAW